MSTSVVCHRCGSLTDASKIVSVPVSIVMLPVNGFERGPYCADCLGHVNLLGVSAIAAIGIVAFVVLAIYV
jgi:hypothetical protein